MKPLILLIAILAVFTFLNFAARGKGKLTGPANKSIVALANCLRFIAYGVLVYTGFLSAGFIHDLFFR